MGARLRSVARSVACGAVVCTAAYGVLQPASQGASEIERLLDRADRRNEANAVAHYECLARDLERQVPPSSRLFVAATDPEAYQRLAEAATPVARLVPSEAEAELVADLAPAPDGAGCQGRSVTVRRP